MDERAWPPPAPGRAAGAAPRRPPGTAGRGAFRRGRMVATGSPGGRPGSFDLSGPHRRAPSARGPTGPAPASCGAVSAVSWTLAQERQGRVRGRHPLPSGKPQPPGRPPTGGGPSGAAHVSTVRSAVPGAASAGARRPGAGGARSPRRRCPRRATGRAELRRAAPIVPDPVQRGAAAAGPMLRARPPDRPPRPGVSGSREHGAGPGVGPTRRADGSQRHPRRARAAAWKAGGPGGARASRSVPPSGEGPQLGIPASGFGGKLELTCRPRRRSRAYWSCWSSSLSRGT